MEIQQPHIKVPARRHSGQTRHLIYDFILAYSEQNGFPPTIREIAKAVGVSSSGTISAHLKHLEQEQLIRRFNNRARAIQPVTTVPPYAMRMAALKRKGGEN